jgi:hypothetical protein
VAHTDNADDSYDSQIARQLALSPEARVQHLAGGVRALRAWPHRRDDRPFDPVGALAMLSEHDVRFILIGTLAGTLHGSPLLGEDLEITPDPMAENLNRLDDALREVTSQRMSDLEVVTNPPGTQGYVDLRREMVEFDLGGDLRVQVASLADLVRMTEASGRPKDIASRAALRAVLERLERD